MVARTIAENAFWAAAGAFDDGQESICRDFLAFAAAIHPEIESSSAWRRLRLKRRIGAPVWRAVSPVMSRVKALFTPRPILAPPRPGFGTK